jgi:Domain of unknown function (DUF4335)
MESDSLTNRTYTALTCKLIVSKDKQSSGLDLRSGANLSSQKQHLPVDFTLHLDHPDHGELERVTLYGQFHQLDRLQQVVSIYITELIAKFPFPTMNNNSAPESMRSINPNLHQDLPTPAVEPDNTIGGDTSHNELMNNLPGLRHTTGKSAAANSAQARQNPTANAGISKLFGGWKKQHNSKEAPDQDTKLPLTPLGAAASVKSGFGKREVDQRAAATTDNNSQSENSPSAPYLTGSERSLDRQLHLGDLANSTSGDTLTLSPIQLFDLSNVLDEYAVDVEVVDGNKPPQKRSNTLSRNIATNLNQETGADTAATPLSRLPNLPRTFSSSQTSQVYNRTQTSQPSRSSRSSGSLLSAIPWAAAAAVVVGVPFLFPNQFKDATSKVKIPAIKMPDMEGVTKNVTAAMSPPVVDPEPTNLPKPWETQPVQPPQSKGTPLNPDKQALPATVNPLKTGTQTPLANGAPVNTGTQPIQADSKPGLAPLPQTLDGIPELPTTANIPATNVKPGILGGLPRSGVQSSIAPNPLSSSQLPGERGSSSTSELKPITKSGINPVKPATKTIPSKTTGLPSKTSTINPGAVSISTQPILIPSDLPGIGINSPGSSAMPAVSLTTKPKAPKQKVKPAAMSKTDQQQAATATGIDTIRQPAPTFDRSSPVPATANFNQEQPQPTSQSADFPITPILPTQSFSPNPVVNGPEEPTADSASPALKEVKRYFQSKWKASSSQSDPLQYIVQINGKSGTVKNVAAQGEAATTYLQKSKFVKPGQKLVAPIAGGASQKIRVVLQPDGNVDTFVEPE